ncbi:aldehyde dehydrogenase family protein [Thalassospira povalilytica]|uniref:Aldehyde dehydrogenase n=1 Tax=Thalassospira povalilytica TaxID=732237 RepID=A0A8I1SJ00_9PROT|nr:aldehyde dehydrogenase family protein [Thalassospira povalilytica]MBN8195911.1 aldehyde dehydrogenase [Thalassospira povalilytica]
MGDLIKIRNWIAGKEASPSSGLWLTKFNPHSGEPMSEVAGSNSVDVAAAVQVARSAFDDWSSFTPLQRGQFLADIASKMRERRNILAACVAEETGKPPQDAAAEVSGAILQADFFAGEGMRLYGRTLTSSMPHKSSRLQREAIGVAGLIVPSNTPIANIAWKMFPALICGNTVVLKAAEDAPGIAHLMAELTRDAGLPDGVFNVIQGDGGSAGAALVAHPDVDVISFTGSTSVGRKIATIAGERLARVSLELGGKNPFIVCDDANIDEAAKWAALSAFSNAGQRCAAASRIYVQKSVYGTFKEAFAKKANSLKLGIDEGCDLGPLINKRQYEFVVEILGKLSSENLVCGGLERTPSNIRSGYYIRPTILESLPTDSEIHKLELFAPVACLYSFDTPEEAVEKANDTDYGLTAAIHTASIDRAEWFARKVRAGVVNINIGTYGSEPHMPFGGFGVSGNGTREPGLEALDVYSELKNISVLSRPFLI